MQRDILIVENEFLLADALGLSAVHANRTVQALRGEGMVEMEAGHPTILD
jgi:DNA-binding transcriptional regulator LsrR (DeoR family)